MIKKIGQQPKTCENPIFVDIKSVTIENSKISCKLCKTLRQAEKTSWAGSGKSSNSPIYSEKKVKSSCNFEILNSFNPKLQLKDN